MAAAVRLSVVCVGPFGRAVAERLAAGDGVAVTPLEPGAPLVTSDLPVARAYALASWRPPAAAAEALDRLAHAWGVPWLAIVAEHPLLRVGPTVVPGRGACRRCFEARRRQHAPAPELADALERHYRAHPQAGPRGHLPAHAAIAAALATEALERAAADPAAEAGRVRQFHVVTQRLSGGRAVGLHGCPRCGRRRDERTRSYHPLTAELAEVLA
jgi:bacteriocin biosynthesis cyclodehydratase domain-containing protein